MRSKKIPWYTEEAGFFGHGYLEEYAGIIGPEQTKKEVDFLERILCLKSATKILDIPCGHGRHTIELARRGYKMTGQDINSLFLEKARQEAEKTGLDIRWIKSDMRKIPFKDEFDVAINLFTSFGYLESLEEDIRFIEQLIAALRPKGRFVLDVINRERIMRHYREKEWRQYKNLIVLIERRFDFVTSCNYEHILRIWADGRREEKNIVVRLYTLTELIAMCKNVGLQVNNVYGDYNAESFSFDCKRCILFTQRKR